MVKFFFRLIALIVFLLILIAGLSFWKGGEPFRWLGGGIKKAGTSVSDFGNFIDDIIAGGKDMGRKYDEIKDVIDRERGKKN